MKAVASISLVAVFVLSGCEFDAKEPSDSAEGTSTAPPTRVTALDKEPIIVTVRGRLVRVGGPYTAHGTTPVTTGTVRLRSSSGTFQGEVDRHGRFELRAPQGRYYAEGAIPGHLGGGFHCGTATGAPVSITGREPAISVYCSMK